MNQKDKIKLGISRNWKFPGQMRLLNLLRPTQETSNSLKDGIIWLEQEDLAIYTTADNYIENSIISTGTYESEIAKLISFSLRTGANALDIGCNIGLQSLRMSKVVGASGKVISFEPLSYLRKKSEKNFKLNCADNIKLLPFALSDTEQMLQFNIDETIFNQGTFSLSQSINGTKTENIEVKIGDNIEEIRTLEMLALIKIDVEGFEYNVLRGLLQTLSRLRPRIIFEYDSNYWGRNDQNVRECYLFLKNLNYSLFQISFLGCTPIFSAEEMQDGNIFCISDVNS